MTRNIMFFLYLFLFVSSIAAGQKPGNTNQKETDCYFRNGDFVIDWGPDVRLKWANFKARYQRSSGFAVATTVTGFNFELKETGDQVMINVYVHFFCYDSWKNPDWDISDVLEHEQLHFDICEVYGRLLYKKLTDMREQGILNQKDAEKQLELLHFEFDEFQRLYDKETDFSMNGKMQRKWRQNINIRLSELQHYADYKEYTDD